VMSTMMAFFLLGSRPLGLDDCAQNQKVSLVLGNFYN